MSEPTRHHWVPQFILRGFAIQGGVADRVWVYRPDRQPVVQSIKDTAVKSFLYASKDSGKWNMDAEEVLSKLESLIPPIIDDLKQKRPLYIKERETLAKFIALQLMRTPLYRASMLKRFSHWNTIDIGKFMESSFPGAPKSNWHDFEPGPQDDASSRVLFLVKMFDELLRKYPALAFRRWTILHARDDCPFVTSSCGYAVNTMVQGKPAVNLHDPDLILYLPLTARMTIEIMGPPQKENVRRRMRPVDVPHVNCSRDKINAINQCMAYNADSFVVADRDGMKFTPGWGRGEMEITDPPRSV